MEQLVGRQLGKYDIVEMIGKGGMAAVYKGYQASMNRYVAVKVMAQQFSDDEAFVNRFKNEAQLIAQLEHAHILPVYDFGEQEGLLYIAMRYLPTGTLEDRIVAGGMPTKDAVSIFTQVASALDYAHSQGIIHRDLKPANILIDAQGNAFLSDFGIAKSLEGGQNLTGTGSVVGTPTYMSPEQGLGEEIDARTDIYALGIMLFEMLTGRVPFSADNPMAVMLKHINEPPPALRQFKESIHEEIEGVVLQAIAKEKEARFQTAREMIDALNYAVQLASGNVTVRPPRPAAARTIASSPLAPTMPTPVAGAPQPATAATVPGAAAVAEAGITAPPAPTHVSELAALDDIKVELNALSTWLAKREWLGHWLQAGGLSAATFVLLLRLTEGALLEVGLLSLVPGLLLYGLLRAPMVGALTSMLLILIPLLAHSPGLAALWLIGTVIAGARLSSREIMLSLFTLVAAGHPLGWVVPLLFPWWVRSRRMVVPAAFGVIYATLFAITLGWPDAGGLLPVPRFPADILADLSFSAYDTTYLGLFEDADRWLFYRELDLVTDNILLTADFLSSVLEATRGLPFVAAAAWALASVLTTSNARVSSRVLRASGIGLGYLLLVGVHVAYHPEDIPLPGVTVVSLLLTVVAAAAAFALSQWPIQADPAKGSQSGTILNLLRRTLGAFYMALGVGFFAGLLMRPLYSIPMWLVAGLGILVTIANPLIGPPITFAALVAALLQDHRALGVILAVTLFLWVILSFAFDRRRPRTWNPLGAGMIIGSPGMALMGILPLGPISMGALEAQVPSALLAIAAQVVLVTAVSPRIDAFALIVQIITALAGVLVVERLMSVGLLSNLHQKLRRLIFTGAIALAMAVSYYTLGRAAPDMFWLGMLVSVVAGAMFVLAMGNRAMFWRQFIERKDEDEIEEAADEDVTGPWARSKKQP
jgi:tRNA A-37 threonylcarbamoyl transferase component Bud32